MKTKINKKIEKKIESLPVQPEVVLPSDSTSSLVAKIASFSGDFGRVDINLLRDKVNEVIDFLNK